MEREFQLPIEVFCYYAPEDRAFYEELCKHLAGLLNSGLITVWHDGDISPGTAWEQEIKTYINTARIILLLVSPGSLGYCYSTEMVQAMERHRKEEAYIVPVFLRPVVWEGTPLSGLKGVPSNTIPVTRWSDRDEAFEDIVRGIKKVVEKLINELTIQSPSSAEPQKMADLLDSLQPLARIQPVQGENGPHKRSNRFISSNLLSTQWGNLSGAITVILLFSVGLLIYSSFHMVIKLPSLESTRFQTPSSSDILYQADWSNGLNGWSGSTDWKVVDTILISDGSNGSKASPTVEPPYRVNETSNYAVETRIQQIQSSNGQSCFDAAFLRGSTIPDGVEGYRLSIGCIAGGATIYVAHDSLQGQINLIAHKEFQPGNSWHTYRLEARGTTISAFIDGLSVMQVNDSTFLSGGIIGVKSKWTQIDVSSFKVMRR